MCPWLQISCCLHTVITFVCTDKLNTWNHKLTTFYYLYILVACNRTPKIRHYSIILPSLCMYSWRQKFAATQAKGVQKKWKQLQIFYVTIYFPSWFNCRIYFTSMKGHFKTIAREVYFRFYQILSAPSDFQWVKSLHLDILLIFSGT